jgi:hypothetical protein
MEQYTNFDVTPSTPTGSQRQKGELRNIVVVPFSRTESETDEVIAADALADYVEEEYYEDAERNSDLEVGSREWYFFFQTSVCDGLLAL